MFPLWFRKTLFGPGIFLDLGVDLAPILVCTVLCFCFCSGLIIPTTSQIPESRTVHKVAKRHSGKESDPDTISVKASGPD